MAPLIDDGTSGVSTVCLNSTTGQADKRILALEETLARRDADIVAKDEKIAALEAELSQLRAILPAGAGVATLRSPTK